jgi:hypothetical protein
VHARSLALPLLFSLLLSVPADASGPDRLDEAAAGRFARLALDCVHREYPNKIAHVMNADADAKPPRELTPAFCGCFDWHSSVHGHWLLARLARLYPSAPFAAEARAALGKSLTEANVAGEVAYLSAPDRIGFERPYGLAWLLQLTTELREWDDPQAKAWSKVLAPLEAKCAEMLFSWIPKLAYPIREGEHPQTAFAFGLVLDWALDAGETERAGLLARRVVELYGKDKGCPIGYEPSGQDFLSPCLAEADLMRRFLPPDRFARWLSGLLPALPTNVSSKWLAPGVVTDRTDGKLIHLDGLNLSRAWMLQGIAAGLPKGDPRIRALRAAADLHAKASLPSVISEHYEGSHWLGTFAVYLLTERGLPPVLPR